MMTTSRLFLFASAVLVSGCVSVVKVTRADSDTAAGIHYYLPQVFLQITPNKDGSFKVDTVYLPDPANRYTIQAESFLGNYTMDVNRSEEGFLETVSFNSDNTGVAKQLIASQAAVKAAEIEAATTRAQKAAADAKAATEKDASKVSAAEEAQKAAQIALDVAIEKLKLLQKMVGDPKAPDDLNKQILAAQLAVAEAKVKHDATIVATGKAVANFAAANGEAKSAALKAMSPAFLKVVMTKDSVDLQQAFLQKKEDSWNLPVKATSADEFALRPGVLVVRPAEKSSALTAEVRSNQPLRGVTLTSFRSVTAGKDIDFDQLNVALLYDQTTIRIDLAKGMAAGKYRLRLDADTGTEAAPKPNDQALDITIEK